MLHTVQMLYEIIFVVIACCFLGSVKLNYGSEKVQKEVVSSPNCRVLSYVRVQVMFFVDILQIVQVRRQSSLIQLSEAVFE